jgi:EmrB/QacA subfamily drug resistance transporter
LSTIDLEAYLSSLTAGDEFKDLFRRYGRRYRWYAVFAIVSGNVAAVLASTIINVAIPSIMGAFGIGQEQAQWLATANLAACTIAMLCGSWAVQAIGLRGTVFWMMVLFLAGSVLGGVATNLEVMIVARILQGIPAGLLMPLSITIIFQVFPPGKQGVAMGISAIGIVVAPAVGPALGGLAVDMFSWRYVFFFGIPFSLVTLFLALFFLPGRAGKGPLPAFDTIGMGLLIVAVTTLLVALSNGEQEGWSSSYILSLLFVCAVSTALFVYRELVCRHPLLDLTLFMQRQFLLMSAIGFLFGAGLYASTYLVPLFLQLVQHMSPTEAGALLMPAGLVMALIFPISGRLADVMDLRLIMTSGVLFFALSFSLMAGAGAGTGFWTFAGWVIISRIGIGLVMPALQMGALQGIEAQRITQASGGFSFVRQMGGVFGVNLSSVFLDHRSSFHFQALADTQRYDNGLTLSSLRMLESYATAIGHVGVDSWNMALMQLRGLVQAEALILGFRDSFIILAAVFIATLIPVWLLRSRKHALAAAST